ncbi:hypothetical protein GCM10010405_61370 [Streptomyces macrosporus]|uniref:Uncharacterized protein n=1 Tax=Streptomyces macrosporus TaxID=44032 RepID=A0ABP5XXG0_9ACTN
MYGMRSAPDFHPGSAAGYGAEPAPKFQWTHQGSGPDALKAERRISANSEPNITAMGPVPKLERMHVGYRAAWRGFGGLRRRERAWGT